METQRIKTKKLVKTWMEQMGVLEADHRSFSLSLARHLFDAGVVSLGQFESEQLNMRRLKRLVKKRPPVHFNPEHQIDGHGGLTLRFTPHALSCEEKTIHALSAWEALQVPVILDRTMDLSSSCGITGEAIELRLSPMGYETAVEELHVSFLFPEDLNPDNMFASSKWSHFIASTAAAETYLDENPDHMLVPISQCYQFARDVVEKTYGL